MRSAGATLLLAGALGAVTYSLNAPREDASRQQAGVARIVTSQARDVTEQSTPRIFSPQRPLLAPEPAAVPAERGVVSARPGAQGAPAPASTVQEPPLPAVVAIQPRKSPTPSVEKTQPAARLASAKPLDEDARDALVRDLQRELKRLGCYEGEVDGDWGSGSRRAMRSFTERVNAALPTEEPDYILLSLAKGHSAPSCGKTCSSSQVLDGEGRCQPKATSTQAARAAGPGKSRSDLEPRVVALEPPSAPRTEGQTFAAPLPGRMAVGGPGTLPDAAGVIPVPALVLPRTGGIASLDRDAASDGIALQPQPTPPQAARQAEPVARAKSGPSPRRERERERTYRPARESYSPPARYSSFSRRGAVHDFFFDPRRTSY